MGQESVLQRQEAVLAGSSNEIVPLKEKIAALKSHAHEQQLECSGAQSFSMFWCFASGLLASDSFT